MVDASDSATACLLARAGSGVGIVNPCMAAVFEGALQVRPLAPAMPVEAVMAFAAQTALAQAARVFADGVRQHFKTAGQGASAPGLGLICPALLLPRSAACLPLPIHRLLRVRL